MTPYLTLALALALPVGCWQAYNVGEGAGRDAMAARVARDDHVAAVATEAAASAAASAIANIKVQNATIRQTVERETRLVPEYRDCVHSAVGLRNVNAALTGEVGALPADPGQLPASDPAR